MSAQNGTQLSGRLKRWNEAKGFGFISTEDPKSDIFIHISDLKGMSRRPIVGDTIHYQVKVQDDGKNRAINASIEGVASINDHNNGGVMNSKGFIVSLSVAIIVGVILGAVFL